MSSGIGGTPGQKDVERRSKEERSGYRPYANGVPETCRQERRPQREGLGSMSRRNEGGPGESSEPSLQTEKELSRKEWRGQSTRCGSGLTG